MTSSVDDEDVTWSFNVTEGEELVTQGEELVTQGEELVAQGEELVTQGEELVTQKLGFTMKTSAILDF